MKPAASVGMKASAADLNRWQKAQEARAVKKQAQRDLIVQTTATLLEESGGWNLTTNAIAARSRVGVGPLYRQFPGKATEVLLALMARDGAEFKASFAPMAEKEAWEPAVRRLTSALLSHYRLRPKLATELAMEEQRLASHMPRGVLAQTSSALLVLLKEHTDREHDPALQARYLSMMITGMGLIGICGGGGDDPFARERMLAVLRGYFDRFSPAGRDFRPESPAVKR